MSINVQLFVFYLSSSWHGVCEIENFLIWVKTVENAFWCAVIYNTDNQVIWVEKIVVLIVCILETPK